MSPQAETSLVAEDLSFSYSDGKEVLRGVGFRIEEGSRTAVVGPNGAGKTTLFLLLCGILEPRKGEIRVHGRPVVPGRFNPEITYLFQSPDDQLFSSTIWDDVAFGPLNMGLPPAEVEERVAAALRNVGCEGLADRSPHHLSGGERRLAALASILSMSPSIILLDEPTVNLDSRNSRNVITLVRRMPQTLLISSHDLEFLLETCDRVLLLDKGQVVQEGPIVEVFGNDELMHAHHLEKPHSLRPHRHLDDRLSSSLS